MPIEIMDVLKGDRNFTADTKKNPETPSQRILPPNQHLFDKPPHLRITKQRNVLEQNRLVTLIASFDRTLPIYHTYASKGHTISNHAFMHDTSK